MSIASFPYSSSVDVTLSTRKEIPFIQFSYVEILWSRLKIMSDERNDINTS
jgi:hypothetical protein